MRAERRAFGLGYRTQRDIRLNVDFNVGV